MILAASSRLKPLTFICLPERVSAVRLLLRVDYSIKDLITLIIIRVLCYSIHSCQEPVPAP
jgi:hypothetical protein